jgi:hypothetical protein
MVLARADHSRFETRVRLGCACFMVEHPFLLRSVAGVMGFVLGADVQFAAAWHTNTFHCICNRELRGAI